LSLARRRRTTIRITTRSAGITMIRQHGGTAIARIVAATLVTDSTAA